MTRDVWSRRRARFCAVLAAVGEDVDGIEFGWPEVRAEQVRPTPGPAASWRPWWRR
jgi:hypothetical protein